MTVTGKLISKIVITLVVILSGIIILARRI
nr:MAG TPA: hypothetical protein [Caudoviricetes sp.]